MNLGPFTHSNRLAAPGRRSRALVGTAALLFLALGAAACGSSGPDAATAPAAGAGNAVTPAGTAADETPAAGAGGSVPGSSPAATAAAPARPAAGSAQWPQLTWYTLQGQGMKHNDPARVWRRTTGGTWQVVRTGRPGSGTAAGQIAVSPDGQRVAWVEASAGRLVISAFDGTKQHAVGTQSGWTCTPSWLDSGRVLFSVGREGDWALVAINADGTGRRVLANHQADCPAVANGWWAQVAKRTVSVRNERGIKRTVTPRIPAGLEVDRVAGISTDGRTLVLSTSVPTAGGCGCGSRFRNYRVDAVSGAASELAPLDPAWKQPTGHGEAVDAVFVADGGLVVQVNTGTPADDPAAYRLVRYAADGRVLANAAVPAGQPWGSLLG